jgi:hypothetical protein
MLLWDDTARCLSTVAIDPVYGYVCQIRSSFYASIRFTEGCGLGDGQITLCHAESDLVVCSGQLVLTEYDPRQGQWAEFRFDLSPFPGAGYYWMEFRNNGKICASALLRVK